MRKKRGWKRFQIGSTVGFQLNGVYYQGTVSNSSRGGLLVAMPEGAPREIDTEMTLDIRLSDIFSEIKLTFPSRVVRKSGRDLALEFLSPLTAAQKKFIERWLSWQP